MNETQTQRGAVPDRIETASGKGASDENFPVGSFLIAKEHRPTVAAYYAFARAIDDIADDPKAAPDEKIARLEAMDEAVATGNDEQNPLLYKAHAVREHLLAVDVNLAHARDLIVAFKQDCEKNRYRTWAELMGYCNNSASPVGRFLLEMHGEDPALFRQSDALCNALQVINHLQDCKKDLNQLNRSYLPEVWLKSAGETAESVRADKATPGLRAVFDQCLAATNDLLAEARNLPHMMLSRRLALETSVIVEVADKLVTELKTRDPLAETVKLNKVQYGTVALKGIWRGWRGPR